MVIFRKIIPWQTIIDYLVRFYSESSGRLGVSLRIVTALLILQKLKLIGDKEVISEIQTNRYMQYFCNVPDNELKTFINSSSICKIRQRFGSEGCAFIENAVFNILHIAGVIKNDAMLTDSTVLDNNIEYPTDFNLIYKSFGKMRRFAEKHDIDLWWNDKELKKLRREYSLNKDNKRFMEFLSKISTLFCVAFKEFKLIVNKLELSEKTKEKIDFQIQLLENIEEQTTEKLAGKKHIKDRIVSIDEPDARPIVKGKKHPKCEFGTTLQLSFNRQGFMITAENFVGKPNDTTLLPKTTELFVEKMKSTPEYGVTDLGYRSQKNFKVLDKFGCVFLGKNQDVPEDKQDFCKRARSATEGFIAVSKNLRGFGCSLYKKIEGDRVWSRLCQVAYNLKKFILLYRKEEISEESLIKLRLLS